MGSQQQRLPPRFITVIDPQGVPHVPSRVTLGDVEHLKVVVVPLHFGTFHHAETHGAKSAGYLPHHLGRGMKPSDGRWPAGQSNVEALLVYCAAQEPLADLLTAPGQRFLQAALGLVTQRAQFPALLQR